MAVHSTNINEAGERAMSHGNKVILMHIVDNLFWLFLILMIVFGSAVDTPFINVGLTAR